MRKVIPITAISTVTAGRTTTLDLATNLRYHQVHLQYKTNANQAAIETAITGVRCKVNGTVVRTASAAQINSINALSGHAFVAGMLSLFFSDPSRRGKEDEDILAWGMANIRTFQIEVDFDAAAVAPTLEAFAVVDTVRENFVGIMAWRKFLVSVTATGIRPVQNLPRSEYEGYSRIHLFENAPADILSVDVTVEDQRQLKVTAAQNSLILLNQGLVAQSGVFSVCFDHDQRITSVLPMTREDKSIVSDFRLDLDMDNASNVNIIAETFGNIRGV